MSQAWHIIGAGAIGCLFGQALAAQSLSVQLVLREATSPTQDVTLERDGQPRKLNFPCTAATSPAPISRLLVTTKAYDVVAAVDSVRHRLTPEADIVLLANGLGFTADVARLVPDARLYNATTTEGVFRRGPWAFCHAGRGQTLVGASAGTAAPDWFTQWENTYLGCRWTHQVDQALWKKLAINCAINPLTAIHRCRNGELAARPELAAEVRGLCREIAAISTAAGFTETAANIEQEAFLVIEGTASNHSSMLQDTLAGRPTEIDFITGYLVARALELGQEAPLNNALLEQIRHA